MHSPYYKDEGQIDDNLTVKSTLLFGLVEKGHIQFYVNKFKEAEGSHADGVSLVVYADEKEIARVKENPYLHVEPRHTVTFDFDIPAGTKFFTIKIEMNDNMDYDHTFIEKLDVRKPRIIGWIAFSACVIIILFLLLGSEIKDVKEYYSKIKARVKALISKGHWQGFIREPIFYIALISVLARIVYFYDWIPFWMTWDTIFFIKESIINIYRVPFYPIFSRLVHFGDEFMWYRTMVTIQSLCGIIAAGCFYRIAEWLIKNKRAAFFCAVFYSCLPDIVVFERGLLSESFAISFTVFLIYCITRYLQNPNKISAMMIGVWSIMLTMLKELYIPIIIPLFLLFWIIRLFLENDGAPVKAGFKWIFICWGIVLFHAYLFNAKIGVFANGIISTNYNMSHTLVQYDLYQNPIDPEINDEISLKGKITNDDHTFYYMNTLQEKFGVKRMTRYWKDALRKNFGGFLKYSIGELKRTWDRGVLSNGIYNYVRGYIKRDINGFIKVISELPEEEWEKLDVRYKEKMNGEFFAPLFFNIKLWHIWALIFIEAIIILHSLVHRKRILYLEIIINGITVAIFLAAIIMAWGYDQRLSSPALPLVILLVFLNLSRLFDSKKYESTTPHL
jgi:hypothetical protein